MAASAAISSVTTAAASKSGGAGVINITRQQRRNCANNDSPRAHICLLAYQYASPLCACAGTSRNSSWRRALRRSLRITRTFHYRYAIIIMLIRQRCSPATRAYITTCSCYRSSASSYAHRAPLLTRVTNGIIKRSVVAANILIA